MTGLAEKGKIMRSILVIVWLSAVLAVGLSEEIVSQLPVPWVFGAVAGTIALAILFWGRIEIRDPKWMKRLAQQAAPYEELKDPCRLSQLAFVGVLLKVREASKPREKILRRALLIHQVAAASGALFLGVWSVWEFGLIGGLIYLAVLLGVILTVGVSFWVAVWVVWRGAPKLARFCPARLKPNCGDI